MARPSGFSNFAHSALIGRRLRQEFVRATYQLHSRPAVVPVVVALFPNDLELPPARLRRLSFNWSPPVFICLSTLSPAHSPHLSFCYYCDLFLFQTSFESFVFRSSLWKDPYVELHKKTLCINTMFFMHFNIVYTSFRRIWKSLIYTYRNICSCNIRS